MGVPDGREIKYSHGMDDEDSTGCLRSFGSMPHIVIFCFAYKALKLNNQIPFLTE